MLCWQVCKEGKVLDANQASILRVFGYKMATFNLKLLASWNSEGEGIQGLRLVVLVAPVGQSWLRDLVVKLFDILNHNQLLASRSSGGCLS